MRRSRHRVARRPHPAAIERLEERRVLAGFSTTGTTLAIDLTKAGTLAVSTSGGGNYLFTLEGGDTFSGSDAAGLTGNGTDKLTVTSDLDLTQVNVGNSVGNTAVRFADSADDYVDSFGITLAGIAGLPGWVPSVKFVGHTAFAGGAALNVSAPAIAVDASTVSTEAGSLTLAGDTGSPFEGNFTGLTLMKSSSVSTESGSITLRGRGGNGAVGSQNGVIIGSGSSVTAGSTASKAAVPLKITGYGGAASGSVGSNHGIVIETGGEVVAFGGISLDGTGGSTTSGNRGVFVSGRVTATDPGGSITITGKGGGATGPSAADNHGVFIGNQSLVSADGAIVVTGTAGPGQATSTTPFLSSTGVYLNSAHVSSSDGDVKFNGDSFRLQGTGGAIAGNRTVSFANTTDGQVMLLDKPANGVLARTYAKAIHFGTKSAVIEQDVAAAGGTLVVGTADLTVSGSAIRLRSDVTSGGAQTWDGPVTLGAATTKGAAAGDVRLTGNGIGFADNVDGAKNLTLVAGSSPVRFALAVGKTVPLASLRVESASAVKAASTLAIDGSAAGAAKNGLAFASGVTGVDMQVPGSTIVNAPSHGISLAATGNSTLAGFTVRNAGVAGIRAIGAMPSTKLVGIRVEGSGRTPIGASLADTTGLAFGTQSAGNVITGVSTAVLAAGDMTGATVRGNVIDANSAGINLVAARGLEVSANKLSTNTLYGIRAEGNDTGSVVKGNSILGSTFGVVLEGAKGLRVGAAGAGNVVQPGINAASGAYDPSRASTGLQATGDLSGTIVTANSFSDNTIGARLSDARGLAFRDGNLLFRNRFQAIAVSGTSTSTVIRGSTIEGGLPGGGRAPFGIWLSSATGLTVGGDADADVNGVFGTVTAVQAGGVLTGSAVKRTIVRNMTNGIVLASAQGLWVQSNDVNGAEQQGLNANGNCAGTTVLFNRILAGRQGVVIDAAKSLAVKNNVIDRNRAVGVFATGACNGTKVSDNAVVDNGVNLATSTATGGWFQPT